MFNLAKIDLEIENQYDEKRIVMTSVHEIFHILGFSATLQQNFHDRVNPNLYPNL